MSLASRASSAYRAFFAPGVAGAVNLDAPPVAPPGPTGERTRARRKRRIAPIAIERVRWLRADIEKAEHSANSGNLQQAAQIADWCKADLVVGGLLSTRCSVPRLPREWRGDDEARVWLQGEGQTPGVFDAIFPPGELEELAIDHLDLGVGIGCFVKLPMFPFLRLVRLDNQYLRYLPGEDRWQYQGYGKTYNVNPGDGVWFMHANGEIDPWRRGIWAGLGYDQVSEDGAGLHRDGFIWRFGNPFVIAKAPAAASEDQKLNFWGAVKQWTMGFAGVTPGHDVSLLQPKAEGREVFKDAEERVERRAMIRIAGQVVTTTGGVGFANAEIFQTIASHLVARTGQDLAATLNAQAIPLLLQWASARGFLSSRDRRVRLAYDTTPPQAREAEAKVLKAAMEAFVAQWDAAEKAQNPALRPDPEEYRARFRLPVVADRVAAVHAALRALTADERAMVLRQLAPGSNGGNVATQDGLEANPHEALNGAQISSAVEIVMSVANGQIPRDAGIAQLRILLNIEPEQAEQMMGSAGAGFVPTPEGTAPQTVTPVPPAETESAPAAKEEEAIEPSYSEKLAAIMTERGDAACPHGNHPYCARCGVTERFEPTNDPAKPWRPIWQPTRRAA